MGFWFSCFRGSGVLGLGFRVWASWFRVWGFGDWVSGCQGFRVQASRFGFQGFGFRG